MVLRDGGCGVRASRFRGGCDDGGLDRQDRAGEGYGEPVQVPQLNRKLSIASPRKVVQ